MMDAMGPPGVMPGGGEANNNHNSISYAHLQTTWQITMVPGYINKIGVISCFLWEGNTMITREVTQ